MNRLKFANIDPADRHKSPYTKKRVAMIFLGCSRGKAKRPLRDDEARRAVTRYSCSEKERALNFLCRALVRVRPSVDALDVR
jgi:hypothetical protein